MPLPWTSDHVQTLLDQPQRLLATEPWRTWIDQHGGLDALYAALSALPLSQRQRQLLQLRLEQPGLTNQHYADLLGMHRVTYQRTLRPLLAALAAHLAAQPDPAPAAPPRFPLPAPLTPLIGRSAERAAVTNAILDPATRLITLTGPGGIGKTRLALQLAWDLHAAIPDGLLFLPLTSLNDPALVLPTIAQALSIDFDSAELLEDTLGDFLAAKYLCLILDNAEHLLAAMPVCTAMLRRAPQLTLVVTSRVRLDLPREHVIDLAPFALPPLDASPAFTTLQRNSAIQLFSARAQAAQYTFQLAPATVGAVHAICAQLDGIALAIELAAARLRDFTLEQIASAMHDRLAFLTNGPRDVDPRQRTLLATIGWSYALLPPLAQLVFRRLSVLVDGWTSAAMQAVCADADAPLTEPDALIQTLLNHHLIYTLDQTPDEPRYAMLETIREYARFQLQEHAEEHSTRLRHLQYYVAYTEPVERMLLGHQQMEWISILHAEYPNIRAALAWSVAAQQTTVGLALAGNIWRFWGHVYEPEIEGWLRQLLADVPAQADPFIVGRAYQAFGAWHFYSNDLAAALPLFQQATHILAATEHVWHTASALNASATCLTHLSKYVEAERMGREALRLRQQLGDQGEIGGSYMLLGNLAFRQGHYAEAQPCYEHALACFRLVGDKDGVAMLLNSLGVVATELHQFAVAEHRLQEALALRQQLIASMASNQFDSIEMIMLNLVNVYIYQQRLATARHVLRTLYADYTHTPDPRRTLQFTELCARILLAERAHPQVLTLYGAALQQQEDVGLSMSASDIKTASMLMQQAQHWIPADEIEAHIAAGRQLGYSEEQIIVQVVALLADSAAAES